MNLVLRWGRSQKRPKIAYRILAYTFALYWPSSTLNQGRLIKHTTLDIFSCFFFHFQILSFYNAKDISNFTSQSSLNHLKINYNGIPKRCQRKAEDQIKNGCKVFLRRHLTRDLLSSVSTCKVIFKSLSQGSVSSQLLC